MANKALDPLEFRFNHPEDVERWGGDWHVYDESIIINMPARDLIELEQVLGMPVPDMMNAVRVSSILGDTAAAWTALHLADRKPGPWGEFNPRTLLMEWRKAALPDPPESEGKASPPSPGIGYPEPEVYGDETSGQMGSVVSLDT